MRSASRVLGLLAFAIGLAACSPGPGSSAEVSFEPTLADLRYSCGSRAFGLNLLEQPAEAELENHPSAAALRTFLATPNMDSDFLADSGWHLAGRDATTAEYVAQVGGQPPFVSVGLESGPDGWRVTGWGQCTPQLALDPGVGTATWRLEGRAGPEAQGFTALVTEMACASGRPADGRIAGPGIVYGTTEVLVAFGVRSLGGAQACPSNPETRVDVQLREPLGSRRLLDGGVFPPHDPSEPRPPA